MGAVKIEVYNKRLMDSYDYHNTAHIRTLLKNMSNLEKLSAKGDQVAAAILIDLKTCLGEYGLEHTTLAPDELYAIKMNLINGVPQTDVAHILNVRQHWVSVLIKKGIVKIKYLLTGVDEGYGTTED